MSHLFSRLAKFLLFRVRFHSKEFRETQKSECARELHFVTKFSRLLDISFLRNCYATFIKLIDKDRCSRIEDKMTFPDETLTHCVFTDADCSSHSWICKSRACRKRQAEGREYIKCCSFNLSCPEHINYYMTHSIYRHLYQEKTTNFFSQETLKRR